MSISYSNGAATAAYLILEKIKELRQQNENNWRSSIANTVLDEIEKKAQKIYEQGKDGYF